MDSPELKAFKDSRGLATAEKWLRNIVFLGTMAATATLNAAKATEMSWSEHKTTTITGVAFATGLGLALEWGRRGALHDSHVHASDAVREAGINGDPAPEWTIGNTGNLLVHQSLNI